ncbi:fimbrial biogenesis chaperone [Aeromonas salmonicida]|uniref:fimbrial biogenesis chaperone n=1 Tax=Aeromonas salmonicida TaxID=645 RepID=UPI003D22D634
MRIINNLLLVMVCFASHYATASISLSATRLIFDGKQNEASINVKNDGGQDVMIQTWLESDAGSNQLPPFAITPPLAKLKGGERQLLRALYQGHGLPQDKESVFWLNVQEIPLAVKGQNVLQLALLQRIKVFYRPAGLTQDPATAPAWLGVKVNNGHIELHNPTSYHINMVEFKKDGHDIDGKMIYPGKLLTLAMPAGMSDSGTFSINLVNDYGAVVSYSGKLEKGVSSALELNK